MSESAPAIASESSGRNPAASRMMAKILAAREASSASPAPVVASSSQDPLKHDFDLLNKAIAVETPGYMSSPRRWPETREERCVELRIALRQAYLYSPKALVELGNSAKGSEIIDDLVGRHQLVRIQVVKEFVGALNSLEISGLKCSTGRLARESKRWNPVKDRVVDLLNAGMQRALKNQAFLQLLCQHKIGQQTVAPLVVGEAEAAEVLKPARLPSERPSVLPQQVDCGLEAVSS